MIKGIIETFNNWQRLERMELYINVGNVIYRVHIQRDADHLSATIKEYEEGIK